MTAPRVLAFVLVAEYESAGGSRYVVRLCDQVVWRDTEVAYGYEEDRECERAEERFAAALARVLAPSPPLPGDE